MLESVRSTMLRSELSIKMVENAYSAHFAAFLFCGRALSGTSGKMIINVTLAH